MRRRALLAAGLSTALAGCFVAPRGGRGPLVRQTAGLGSIAVSPDGQRLAAIYRDELAVRENRGRPHQLVLFDRDGGRLRRVRHPELPRLDEPQFSPDGRLLLLSRRRQADAYGGTVIGDNDIAVMDPATGETRSLIAASQTTLVFLPRFRPDGRAVAYVEKPMVGPETLALWSLDAQRRISLLGPEQGFFRIDSVCFQGTDALIFIARAPHDPRLEQQLPRRMRAANIDPVPYRLELTPAGEPRGIPTLLPPLLPPYADSPASYPEASKLVASGDARVLACVSRSRAQPTSVAHGFNYEVFTIEDGRPRELTTLRSYLGALAISRDGRTIAVTENATRALDFDVAIVDASNGEAQRIRVLPALRASGETLFTPAASR